MSNLELLAQIVLSAQPDDIDTSRDCGIITDYLRHLYENASPADPHLKAFVEIVESAYTNDVFDVASDALHEASKN